MAIGIEIVGADRLRGDPLGDRPVGRTGPPRSRAGRRSDSGTFMLYPFGRLSMTRFALPCERSIVAGGTTRTVVGHADMRLDQMLGAALERDALLRVERAAQSRAAISTTTSSSSSRPGRVTSST